MESCFRLLAYGGAALVEATVTHLSPLDSLTSLDHFHFPAPVFLPNKDGPAAASICRPNSDRKCCGWGLGRLTEVRLAHCPMGSAAK